MAILLASRFMPADQIKALPYMIERDYGNLSMWVPTNAHEHFHKFDRSELAYVIFSYPEMPEHRTTVIGVIVKYNHKEIFVADGGVPHINDEGMHLKFLGLEKNKEVVIPIEVREYHSRRPNWSTDNKDFVNCVELSVRPVGDYLLTDRYYPIVISEKPLVR